MTANSIEATRQVVAETEAAYDNFDKVAKLATSLKAPFKLFNNLTDSERECIDNILTNLSGLAYAKNAQGKAVSWLNMSRYSIFGLNSLEIPQQESVEIPEGLDISVPQGGIAREEIPQPEEEIPEEPISQIKKPIPIKGTISQGQRSGSAQVKMV